jgi:hypothetical protein
MRHPTQQMQINSHMHAYTDGAAMTLPWRKGANYLKLLKTSFCLRQTKKIELKHNDALDEKNTCWINILDYRTAAGPAPHLYSTSFVCLLYPFFPPKDHWNSRQLMTPCRTGIIWSSALMWESSWFLAHPRSWPRVATNGKIMFSPFFLRGVHTRTVTATEIGQDSLIGSGKVSFC